MDRLEQIISMRNEGATLQAIGNHFGISRERVRQILIGVDCGPRIDNRLGQIVQMRNEGASLQGIGDHFGITRERVRQLLSRAGYVGQPVQPSRKPTPEEKARAYNKRIDYIREWQQRNPDKVKAYRLAANKRLRERPEYKIKHNLARRIQGAISGTIKAGRTQDLIGCTREELIAHLESLFQPGMSWDNYGVFGWHVDHIRPCASFDLSDPEQQKQCFHYTNLQPLWRHQNLGKRKVDGSMIGYWPEAA